MTQLIVITVMSTVSLLVGVAILRLFKLYRIQRERIQTLQNQLAALCSGAVGTDERILRFEQTLSKIRDHQHALDITAHGAQGYDHAIRLARKGVGISQLIDTCNLSDEEAHLISRMHGRTGAADQSGVH